MERTKNCSTYFNTMPVLEHLQPQNIESAEFPLAFSHLVHHEIGDNHTQLTSIKCLKRLFFPFTGILEAFLAIYFRPSDSHCIYIDKKATETVRAAIEGLVKCYRQKFYSSDEESSKHVFIHEESEVILWGDISILNADRACMRRLLVNDKDSKLGWKYFLNLAGSELPLKSEERLREILKGLNGDNGIIEGFALPPGNHFRLETPHYKKW